MGVSVPERSSISASSPTMSPSSTLRGAPAKRVPEWRPDTASNSCLCCGQQFSLWCRRHHCRACGELVCAECSPKTEMRAEYGFDAPVRVCKHCNAAVAVTTPSPSPSPSAVSSDEEVVEMEELTPLAVDVIASHSTHKHSKLSYDYFVQSEAVSWLVDAAVVRNRSAGAALFTYMVAEGVVTTKPWSGANRTAFYMLNNEACAEARLSHYGGALRSETSKCTNCAQSYLESLAPTPGFCSIDCKTNALINQADSVHIRRYV